MEKTSREYAMESFKYMDLANKVRKDDESLSEVYDKLAESFGFLSNRASFEEAESNPLYHD